MKETLVTLVTLMGLLGCVDFLVHEKVCSLREKLPTHGALVDHFPYLVPRLRGEAAHDHDRYRAAGAPSLSGGRAGGLPQACPLRERGGRPAHLPACLSTEGAVLHSVPH